MPHRGKARFGVDILDGVGSTELLHIFLSNSPGDIKYEDVKDKIREQLGQQLAIRRYLDRLRKATYVDIRT